MAAQVEIGVVDASVVVDLLVGGSASLPSGLELLAPAHLDAEVLSALTRLARSKTVSTSAVDDMLAGLAEIPIQRMPLRALLAPAFGLRDNISVGDSLYVALAQVTDASLFTLDRRLAAACRQFGLCTVAQ
jgi:predicted nucleic acid-binding protein